MKISHILQEDRRSRKIPNFSTALNDIGRYASQAAAAAKNGRRMYKGIENLHGNMFITDPKAVTRKSVNTCNYYTQLLDNLPSWQNYPKRSESLICTTSLIKASNYGTSFQVLPVNGAKFGICPAEDLWFSFRTIVSSMKVFNRCFELCYQIPDRNYEQLLEAILLRKNELAGWFMSQLRHPISVDLKNSLLEAKTVQEVESIFDRVLNPEANGFQLGTINDIPKDSSNEVWTNQKSYLLDVDEN